MWWLSAAINVVYIATICAILMKSAFTFTLLPVAACTLFFLVVLLFVELRLGNLLLHGHARSFTAFAGGFLLYIAFTFYKLWLHLLSLGKVFFYKRFDFVRTPKRGVEEIQP
jgi:hypothetical protein